MHEPPAHAAVALATAVVQAFEQVPQLVALVDVSTQAPLHSVGVAAGHVHTESSHTAPPLHAYNEPQPPQLLASLVKFTHAPLQSVNPLLHVKVQALSTHAAVALAMLVEHAVPHVPQSLKLLVVSTHAPLQSVGVGAEQPDTHVEFEHTGVPPLHANEAPHPPQSLVLLVKSTQAPLHALYPLLHANVHALLTQAAVALATLVEQTWKHEPQWSASLVVSTQVPLQSVGSVAEQAEAHA